MRRLLSALLCLSALSASAQKLSGPRAYTFAKQFVTVSGPRWIGSPGHQKAEDFLRTFFAPEKKKGRSKKTAFP